MAEYKEDLEYEEAAVDEDAEVSARRRCDPHGGARLPPLEQQGREAHVRRSPEEHLIHAARVRAPGGGGGCG